MKNRILERAPDRVITSSRIFTANRETVYKAWTDPVYLARWWGPKGFTNTFHEYDLRPGGRWRFIMHGPDQHNYPNECVFLEIKPMEFLIWNHLSKPEFQIVASFGIVSENQTSVIFNMVFATLEECKKLQHFVPEKNEENFDRLEIVLESMNVL
jgi:uncharacterized protein YndB with AHSA1/START domain